MAEKVKAISTIKKRVAKRGHDAFFIHRDRMRYGHPTRSFRLPSGFSVPVTTLPVDSTGNAAVSCPMDGNDTLGDCGEAMVCHADNILTFGQGKTGFTESTFDLTALENQYEQVSGGDNGLDEDMVINQIWMVGIAGNTKAIILDSLDFDVTNIPLTQFIIDQFYVFQMAWSVPDAFLDGFDTGTVWSGTGIPDPNNGHFVTVGDVGGPNTTAPNGTNVNGAYRPFTWGAWCWMFPSYVASVQPACFVVFSPRQFNAQGYDSKGRHVSTQAQVWVACGGDSTKAAAVVAMFPPATNTTTTPAPSPVPTTTTQPPSPAPPIPPTPSPASSVITIDTNGLTVYVPPSWAVVQGSLVGPAPSAVNPLIFIQVIEVIVTDMAAGKSITQVIEDVVALFTATKTPIPHVVATRIVQEVVYKLERLRVK
jgi:hypothetical protein